MYKSKTKLPYQFISLRQCNRVAYLDVGKGNNTLLFIHGLATYGGTWVRNIEYLQIHARCIAIDLPGNGYSDKDNDSYSIPYFTDIACEFINTLKLKNVIIVGHSMGGQVALNFAIKYPDMLAKLVLCAPAGFEYFNNFEQSLYLSGISLLNGWGDDTQHLTQMIYNSFFDNPHQIDFILRELVCILEEYPQALYRNMLQQCIKSMLIDQVYHQLNNIHTQSLVIFGTMDALIPNKLIHPTSTRQLALEGVKMMKNAQLLMISGAGHFVHFEKDIEVNEAIVNFING